VLEQWTFLCSTAKRHSFERIRCSSARTPEPVVAIANTLIQTCKLNGVDPLAWLTDVLQRIISGRTKNHELYTMLPWNWHPPSTLAAT